MDELEKIALVGAVPKMVSLPRTAAPTPAPTVRAAPTPAVKPPIGPLTGGAAAPASPQVQKVQPRAKTIVQPAARNAKLGIGGVVTKIPRSAVSL